jgi:uncharacterized membrane protein YqgA involved in biofilm formation
MITLATRQMLLDIWRLVLGKLVGAWQRLREWLKWITIRLKLRKEK